LQANQVKDKIKRNGWYIKLFIFSNTIWEYGTTDRYFLCLDDILADD